jgi:ubiquinone/menaquinone biosynthesis C-methylase UbiE
MTDFYVGTLNRLIREGILRRDMKVLVVCAGEHDRHVLLECGFTNVTLSNLDTRMRNRDFAPYTWSFQDAEQLDFADAEFDVVIAHSGLHHAQSPHRALLEMYRVSRVAVIVFEPLDNLLTRLGVRLGMGQEYEVAAVAGAGCRFAGQRNGPIPNYVYRWTGREVEKTIHSYAPVGKHKFLYFYKLRVPWYRSKMMTSRVLHAIFLLFNPLAQCLAALLPQWCNNFAFVVLKPKLPDELHPWLTTGDGAIVPDLAWLASRYRVAPDTAPEPPAIAESAQP